MTNRNIIEIAAAAGSATAGFVLGSFAGTRIADALGYNSGPGQLLAQLVCALTLGFVFLRLPGSISRVWASVSRPKRR